MCYSGKCKYEDHMGNCMFPSGSNCKNENNNNMVRFLKENGFPMTIILETEFDYVDTVNDFKGHYTRVKDENGNILSEFAHADLRARIHWVNGFFTALRMQNKEFVPKCDKESEPKYIVYEYTENASEQYRGTRFMTTYSGNDVVENNKLKVVAEDVTEAEAHAIINEVADKNTNAYLNSLPEELRNPAMDVFIKGLLNGHDR